MIPGMIRVEEQKMLRELGGQVEGIAVEVGCYAGLSTSCLAETFRGQIHVFDKFEITDNNHENYSPPLGLDKSFRGSFRSIFEKNIAPWKDKITIHEEIEWDDTPISLLHIDCAAGEAFHRKLFEVFYGRVKGFLIHQDFFYYGSYYLPGLMSSQPAFDLLGNVETSSIYS
jgi:hypothetical protein